MNDPITVKILSIALNIFYWTVGSIIMLAILGRLAFRFMFPSLCKEEGDKLF